MMTSHFTALQTDAGLMALMACVSGAPREDKAPWFTHMTTADWQRFVSLAFAHRLAALAYRELRAAPADVVPPEVVAQLKGVYENTLTTNVLLYDRLKRILKAFAQADMPVLLLKGAIFAQTLYPSIATRPMGDLDLVIPPDRLEDAEAILQGFGYRNQLQSPGYRSREFLLRYGGELAYAPPKSWPLVELHWQVLFGEWMRRTTAVRDEDFWSRAELVNIDGMTVRQLAAEDSVLHQIGHVAVLHGFTEMGLRVYVDLDRTIRVAGDVLDWASLVERLRRVRLITAAYFVLELCSCLLNTPVPPEVLRAVQPSALRHRLVARTLDCRMLVQHRSLRTASRRRKFLLQLLLVDRPRDMVSLLFRTFLPEREWIAMRYELDDAWSQFVYQLWHPARVLLRGEV